MSIPLSTTDLMGGKKGFSLANKTNDTIYEFLGRNPSRAKRFSTAMTAFSAKSNNLAPFLVENYPWDAVGTGMVVDLGGSKGHISIKLAERYPNLRFTGKPIQKTCFIYPIPTNIRTSTRPGSGDRCTKQGTSSTPAASNTNGARLLHPSTCQSRRLPVPLDLLKLVRCLLHQDPAESHAQARRADCNL